MSVTLHTLAPPPAPTDLSVIDKTDKSVTLSWNSASDLNPQLFSGYYVERCLQGTDNWEKCNTVPIRAPSYTVKSILNDLLANTLFSGCMQFFLLDLKISLCQKLFAKPSGVTRAGSSHMGLNALCKWSQ